uniref:Spermatosis and oosis specific basic helix-loop-helix 2 n=1 Tax=Aotus nancymaae TaxID=37293 RepID=A0A2K5DG49_AOTNA
MAASIICQEHGRISGQAKIDVLLVGDVTVDYLADMVQKFFSNTAEVTITISDMKEAAALLDDWTFNVVFLKMPSSLSAEELEAIQLIRFGKKKNTDSLFVFIIPENFKGCISGHGGDMTLTEPLTMEKLNIVIKYWKTCLSNTVKTENATGPEEPGLLLQRSYSEHLGYFSTNLFACPESLRNGNGLELNASLSEFEKSKEISLLHSSKEKLRRLYRKHSGFCFR